MLHRNIFQSFGYFRKKGTFWHFPQSKRCFSYSRPLFKLCYFSMPSNEPLLPSTLGNCLDTAAEKYASREAMVVQHQNIRRTFTELKNDVNDLAAGFVALGLTKGHRVGIWSPNMYEWVVTQFAAAKAGLILVCINPAYQQRELEYCLKKVGMNAIIFPETFKTQNYHKMLCSAIPSLDSSKPGHVRDQNFPDFTHAIMISEKDCRGIFNYNDVTKAGTKSEFDQLKNLEQLIQCDDPVNIQFTSGTTGNPKGATLSHHNIVNNAQAIGKIHNYHKKPHRLCLHMPLYHCMGNVLGTLTAVIYGACVIIPSLTFQASATAQAIQDENATAVYGTPTMYVDLLRLSNIGDYNFSTLETATVSGAPVSTELIKRMKRELKITSVMVVYGCTETSPVILKTNPLKEHDVQAGPLPHVEVKLVDDKGHVVPCGETGELWARGYLVMLGYWDDSKKTKEVVTPSRWYKTGDIAIMDEQGNCEIVGRAKDMIIRGGENIYPREIEDFLHTHESILDAQVVGVPDERMGEELCAWIQLKPGRTMTVDEIKGFCRGKMAHFKIPRYILFVKNYPKTTTGKIQKFEMCRQSIQLLNLQNVK